jgi:hypothetical protein
MADTKITGLTATATLSSTDILPVVTDPGGSPANKKITQANLASSILGTAYSSDFTTTGAGKGLVVTTPDGAHTYRIAVDNGGVLTTEQLT